VGTRTPRTTLGVLASHRTRGSRQVVEFSQSRLGDPPFHSLVAMASSCPQCAEQNRSSSVEQGYTTSTLIGSLPFTDEQGTHFHDPNGKVTYFRCSRDHIWAEAGLAPCPVGSCIYGKESPRILDADPPLPPGARMGPRGPWEDPLT
jgi:hypothetical protein